MAKNLNPSIIERREGHRDRWTALITFVCLWMLFAAIEQKPFQLQGAVVEALVERGRLHFVRGQMTGIVFENLDTKTPSFRYLFNIFPHEGVYRVNHAPGQFLLAAPWYAVCVKLGWRFENQEWLVWRILVWTLTAPLGALGATCIFVLARYWRMPYRAALLATLTFGLASPWWATSGVLYHDAVSVALILIGTTVWQCRRKMRQIGVIAAPIVAGVLLAYSIVTTYLVVPLVLAICVFLWAERPPNRDLLLFALAFLSTLSILPIFNLMTFGSPLATGYSAGGFYENYPAPVNLANAWEKAGFYLWDSDYGVLWLFPIFFLGGIGLVAGRSLSPTVKKMLMILMLVHFLFIISMEHHGSVGWGMGRFFIPLYPILAFGLESLCNIGGWKGHCLRALVCATFFYSVVFAVAAVGYGVQGVMEPNVLTLKQRLTLDHYQLFQGLFWLTMTGGVFAELLLQTYYATAGSPSPRASRQSRRALNRGSKVSPPTRSRRLREKE